MHHLSGQTAGPDMSSTAVNQFTWLSSIVTKETYRTCVEWKVPFHSFSGLEPFWFVLLSVVTPVFRVTMEQIEVPDHVCALSIVIIDQVQWESNQRLHAFETKIGAFPCGPPPLGRMTSSVAVKVPNDTAGINRSASFMHH
jgi:hypothetical protein